MSYIHLYVIICVIYALTLPLLPLYVCKLGSGEGHTAYFYKRTNQPPVTSARVDQALPQVLIPARLGFDEEDELVYCDPAFHTAVTDAVGKLDVFRAKTHELLQRHLSAGRPVRSRRGSKKNDE